MSLNLNPWFALILGILIGWLLNWLLGMLFYRKRNVEFEARLVDAESQLKTRDTELDAERARTKALEADLAGAQATAALPEAEGEVPAGDLTKAAVVVDLYGQCCDVPAVKAVCDRHQAYLIEDAAQSIGSEWEGRRSGSMSDFGCFSFFPSKNLGAAGDGGMLVAQDAALAERCRLLREHGARPKYYHALVGTNSRLDALQAAILRVKLRHLDRWSEGRAKNARLYDQLFEGSRAVRPYHDPRTRHIYNQYVLRVPRRDDLRRFLTEHGIGNEVYYPVPLHLQECFANLGYREGSMPNAEAAARETIALPIYPELKEEQIRHVAATVREFVDS